MKSLRALRYFLLFGVYGTSPFWVTFMWLFEESLESHYSDYWAGASWYLLPAMLACPITIVFAIAALGVYARTSGSRTRKATYAMSTLACLTLSSGSAAYAIYRSNSLDTANRIAEDKAANKSYGEAGSAFIRTRPEFSAEIPGMKGVTCTRIPGQPLVGSQRLSCVISQDSPAPYLTAHLEVVMATGAAPQVTFDCVSATLKVPGQPSSVGTLRSCE